MFTVKVEVLVLSVSVPLTAFCTSHPYFTTPQELADELTHRFRFSTPVIVVCNEDVATLYVFAKKVPQCAIEDELKRLQNSS